jgi:hypothetical protein
MAGMGSALTRERVATGVTTKQQERQRVVASYRAARKTYQEATAHLVQLEDVKANLLASIAQEKGNLEGFEAGWVRDGYITGKNETERKACLLSLREEDYGYKVAAKEVAECERKIKVEFEPEIARVMWEIKGARYDMELCIAEGLMIASEREDERHG